MKAAHNTKSVGQACFTLQIFALGRPAAKMTPGPLQPRTPPFHRSVNFQVNTALHFNNHDSAIHVGDLC